MYKIDLSLENISAQTYRYTMPIFYSLYKLLNTVSCSLSLQNKHKKGSSQWGVRSHDTCQVTVLFSFLHIVGTHPCSPEDYNWWQAFLDLD